MKWNVSKYLHKGTLHTSESMQRRECNSKSFHILLQWVQPPGTLSLQAAKCRTRSSSPLQAVYPQGCSSSFGSLSCGPMVLHPSLHIWTSASIASYNCAYIFLSLRFLTDAFRLWRWRNKTKMTINTLRTWSWRLHLKLVKQLLLDIHSLICTIAYF